MNPKLLSPGLPATRSTNCTNSSWSESWVLTNFCPACNSNKQKKDDDEDEDLYPTRITGCCCCCSRSRRSRARRRRRIDERRARERGKSRGANRGERTWAGGVPGGAKGGFRRVSGTAIFGGGGRVGVPIKLGSASAKSLIILNATPPNFKSWNFSPPPNSR